LNLDSGVVVIDLDALAHNYRLLCQTVAPAQCGAVVKANAYGLGIGPVATRLFAEGCRHFFVATQAEGTDLRSYLPEVAIYVFEGVAEGDAKSLLSAELTPVLNSIEQIRAWAQSGRSAILNVDTGMTRLGLSTADIDRLADNPDWLARIPIEYLMTHLACADRADHSLNAAQLERFEIFRRKLPAMKTSIGNSAGSFLGEAFRGDLVRPGIALYGGNPFSDRPTPVEVVATLKAKILQIRNVDEPLSVGYGATYAAVPPARLAVVGVGYADGYPRCLGNCGAASVAGVHVPIVGRVSMDLLCLDVSAVPTDALQTGQYVELIGAHIAIDDVAEAAGTISYELLTGLGPRLRREYLGMV